jgi:hypothetical protein
MRYSKKTWIIPALFFTFVGIGSNILAYFLWGQEYIAFPLIRLIIAAFLAYFIQLELEKGERKRNAV